MSILDFVTILGNVSQSLYPVQRLISGAAYLLGLIFVMKALGKIKKIGDHRAQSSSHEKMFTPMMYLMFGAALIYLPSIMHIMANTAFGVGNVLTYTPAPTPNIYSSMGLIIRTAGVIWFIRGCVLVAHASEPGTQEGPKGLVFIIAGIFAMNFDNTIAMINYILGKFLTWTLAIKASQGY
ncbi:type IV secretion protein IcmC [uncultured Legionella sp.]|uniref:type IV secretion protein IcmC n=1 Tax=uncultured Legionella sp. TaxID=210934 RepID=UPI0026245028|nr:type IV secretion protein IcmC [uncultured Legionella sp.]